MGLEAVPRIASEKIVPDDSFNPGKSDHDCASFLLITCITALQCWAEVPVISKCCLWTSQHISKSLASRTEGVKLQQ